MARFRKIRHIGQKFTANSDNLREFFSGTGNIPGGRAYKFSNGVISRAGGLKMPKGRTYLHERRKASQLARKSAVGNRGKRRLKKARVDDSDFALPVPSYFRALSGKGKNNANVLSEIYRNTVDYLRHMGCLDKIPPLLIRDYSLAKYNAIQAYCATPQSGLFNIDDNGKAVLSPHIDARIKMSKLADNAWKPIWDIVSRHGTIASAAK